MADLGMRARGTSSASERRAVDQVLSLARDRTAPEFCYSARLRTQQVAAPHLLNTHVYSGNCAGYAVTESEFGGEIDSVTGSWTIPSHSSAPEPSGEATWVGIGGDLGGETKGWGLIQAGSSMMYQQGFQSWWEYIGSSGCTDSTAYCGQYSSVDAISPGQQAVAYVWWDTSTTATFLFDTSSGRGDYDVTNYPVSIPYDHTSAEWVDENFLQDGYYYDDPGTVHFSAQGLTGSFAGQGSFASPFAKSYEAVIMTYDTDISGTNCSNYGVLSYPADAANTSSGGSSEIFSCSVSGIDEG
jgi:hypothetical protein